MLGIDHLLSKAQTDQGLGIFIQHGSRLMLIEVAGVVVGELTQGTDLLHGAHGAVACPGLGLSYAAGAKAPLMIAVGR